MEIILWSTPRFYKCFIIKLYQRPQYISQSVDNLLKNSPLSCVVRYETLPQRVPGAHQPGQPGPGPGGARGELSIRLDNDYNF